MNTTLFVIKACFNQPINPEWRAELTQLLGVKPRRLSQWCELGLYGALSCIHQANQKGLPSDIPIRVYSEYGTIKASRVALEQVKDYLPMPFTFMQTQPGQLFNALGVALGWHGDGVTTSASHSLASQIALLHSVRESMLCAHVDDEPNLISRWLWLEKVHEKWPSSLSWCPVVSIFDLPVGASWLKVEANGGIYAVT
jgi:hypothetical protein